jgi:hypothetical protein
MSEQGTSGVVSSTAAEPISAPPKLERIYQLLLQTYGEPEWQPTGDALGELVGTILSQHTSDINSGRAYQQLVAAFPSWEAVRDAPVEQVAEAIRCGGLANIKAQRIQEVLRVLTERLHGAGARATNGSSLPPERGRVRKPGFRKRPPPQARRFRSISWRSARWPRAAPICARCRALAQRPLPVSCSFRWGFLRFQSIRMCIE